MSPPRCVLELYVSDASDVSRQAIADLEALCAASRGREWDVSVIDVLEDPKRAERARIVATPTLLRVSPGPERRVVGDLADRERTLLALDLPADGGEA